MECGKVIGKTIRPQASVGRESGFEESQNGLGKLVKGLVIAIIRDAFVHDLPASFDDIEVGAVRWQMVQPYA